MIYKTQQPTKHSKNNNEKKQCARNDSAVNKTTRQRTCSCKYKEYKQVEDG